MPFRYMYLSALAMSIGGLALVSDAVAQETPAQQTLNPELAEAQLQAMLAQARRDAALARQAEAEANRARVAALLPGSDTEGIEGDITVSQGAGYYAEVLAYDALSNSSQVIAAKIKAAMGADTRVLFVEATSFQADVARYNFIESELDRTIASLEDVLRSEAFASDSDGSAIKLFRSDDDTEAAGLGVLAAVPAVLGAARDVAQFFQSEVTITNRAVELQESALRADLFSALLEQRLTPLSAETVPLTNTALLDKLSYLRGLRDELSAIRLTIDVETQRRQSMIAAELRSRNAILTALRAELTLLNSKQNKTPAETKRIKELRDPDGLIAEAVQQVLAEEAAQADLVRLRSVVIGHLDAAITAADSLMTSLTMANATGVSPIQSVGLIDYIKSSGPIHLLFADTVSQGGEAQTIRRAFSGRITYVGGAGVAFYLTDSNGAVLAAGTQQSVVSESFKRRKIAQGINRN